MTVSVTNNLSLIGAFTSFIDAYKAWASDVPDAGSNLVLAADGLASALAAEVAGDEALENELGAIGVPAAIQAFMSDLGDYQKAVLAHKSEEQFTATLAMAADGLAAVGGVATVGGIVAPQLEIVAWLANSLSATAATAKLAFDASGNSEAALQTVSTGFNSLDTAGGNLEVTIVSPEVLGNTSNLVAINLPTVGGNASTVVFAAAVNPTVTPATNSQISDITGSTITFVENGKTYTATALYQTKDGYYVAGNFNPPLAVGGEIAIPIGQVTSVTAPPAGTTKTVTVVQPTDNANGSVTDVDTLFSSANSGQPAVQYANTLNADGSGSITANGQTVSYAAGITPDISVNASGVVTVVLSSSGSSTTPTFTLGTNGITANNIDGSTLTDVSVASNSSYTNTTVNADNIVSTTYNAAGQLTTSTTSYESGDSTVTNYSTVSGNSWQTESFAYNGSGQLIASSVLYNDGSYIQETLDPGTGGVLESTTFNAQGNPVEHYVAPGVVESQITADAAETAASQIIQQVLLKNDVPAAIAASSFVDAAIETATNTSKTNSFAGDFSADVFASAADIGGSAGGELVAKDLGIPQPVGSIVGGTAANFVAQTIVTSVSKGLDIATAAGQVLDAASFQVGLLGIPAVQIGQELAALITPPTIAGEIIGDVGVAAESAALVATGIAAGLLLANPVVGAILIVADLAGVDFIGNAIGDIATWIFGGGYRGAPFAEAEVGLSNGSSFIAGTSVDNNGSPQPAIQLANDVIIIINQIVAAVGGTATLATHWNVGYTGSNYISFQPGTTAYDQFGDAPDAIYDTVSHLLRNMTFVGGNPILKYILATDGLTNIPKLLSDLDIAQQYAVYAQLPVAFELALAEQGSASQEQTWQSVMASATTLGLANLSSVDGTTLTISTQIADVSSYLATLTKMPGTPYNFIFSDTSANFIANLGLIQNLAINGHLEAVFLTDSGTPVLSLSAAQVAAYLNALGALTGNFVLNVSDTAAHVAAALDQLQDLLTTNKLSDLTVTDKGTPVLPIKATQLLRDAGVLHMLGGTYKLAVSDKAVNIAANFPTLQSLQAAGQLASVTPTDGGTPALGLSYAQFTEGAPVLALFTTPFTLILVDTGANVSANLSALQTLAKAGKLTAITLTDTTRPAFSVSVAQTTSYANVLAMLTGQATLDVTGVTPNTTTTINGNGFTLSLAAGDTVQSNGTDSFTDALNGGNLAVTLTNSKAAVDKSGNATFTTPLAGFGSSILTVSVAGLATFTVGRDTLSFAGNSLRSVSYANGAFSFGLASNAAGYSQSVNWNPATGQATLSVTGGNGVPFTTMLGQINPGGVLKIVGSTITNVNATGQTLYATTLNTDGSQVDTQYNLSGGTAKDTVITSTGAGATVSTRWDNTNGTTYTSYYNTTTGLVVANVSISANGSGYVATVNNQTVTFAASDVTTASIGTAGDVLVTTKPNNGKNAAETLDLTANKIVASVGGNSLTDGLVNGGASFDASGNLMLTGGGSTLTLPVSGTIDTFVVGQDTIAITPSSLISVIPAANGAYDFVLNPVASGYREDMLSSPTTGKATFNITSASGQVLSTSAGVINPVGTLKLSASSIVDTNSAGQVIGSIQIAANGAQTDLTNNLGAGTWSSTAYTYTAAGAEVEAVFDNKDTSYVDDIFNAAGTMVTQVVNNANGSGTVTWTGNGSASYTGGTGGMQVKASSTPDSVTVSGTGSFAGMGTTAITTSLLANSKMSFIGANQTIVAAANDAVGISGGSDQLTFGGSDIVQLGAGGISFAALASSLTGLTVNGLDKTDGLDFGDLVPGHEIIKYAPNAAASGGTLTISDGTHNLTIAVNGQYATAGFYGHADGTGGTSVGYLSPTDQTFAPFKAAHTAGYLFAS